MTDANESSARIIDIPKLVDALKEEFLETEVLKQDEATIYKLQDKISNLNEQRHLKSLLLRNVDRKINFLVQSRLQKELKKEDRDKESWFEFFDQSASQDNPLGLAKADYSAFLYLLRLEPSYLAKALMAVPYSNMDYMVQVLNFSLFPDLFQAREEIFLLDLIKHIIGCQVEISSLPQDMFRQNSFVTKLLGGYSKRHYGRVHLVSSLKEVVTEFIKESADGMLEMQPIMIYKQSAGNEFDNTKTDEEIETIPSVKERIDKTKIRLEYYCWRVLDSIKKNLPSMPFGMRYICKQIIVLAGKKFDLSEKQRYTLISSFIILRYFNPAILVPEAFGLADRETDGAARRALVLLTKVLQNYANDTVFGGKEGFMSPFNDSREGPIQALKEYCFTVADVPEPQEYYATVANLPTRKDQHSIFQNTTVTISPNELYSIHRLMDSQRENIIPKHHPLNFFLDRLGAVPENVSRAEDKFFAIQLAGGEEDGTDDHTKKDYVRPVGEAVAKALTEVPTVPDKLDSINDLSEWLQREHAQASSDATKQVLSNAINVIKAVPSNLAPSVNPLVEAERFLAYRKAYRTSLAKEKLEMEKSVETLTSEATQKQAEYKLWNTYLDNIVNSSFKLRVGSKKEYSEHMRIGPFDFNFATLEKAGCFVSVANIDNATRKSAVFNMVSSEPGVVSMTIKDGNHHNHRVLNLNILMLLDLLVQQDHIKIDPFLFDIRGLCAFLNSEICG